MPSVQSGISGLAGFINRTIELRRAERAAAEEQKQAEKQLQIEQLMKMAQTPGIDPQAATGLMQKAAQLAGLKDEDLDAAMGREVQQQMGAPIQPPPMVDPQAAVQARESMTQPENVGEPVTPAPVQPPAGGVIPPPPMVDVDPGQMGMDEALGFQGAVMGQAAPVEVAPTKYDAVASGAMERWRQRLQAGAGMPEYFPVPPDVPERIGFFTNPAYAKAQESAQELNLDVRKGMIAAANEALKDELGLEGMLAAVEQAKGQPLSEDEINQVAGLKVEDTTKKLLSSSEPVSGADLKNWAQASGVEIPDFPDDQMFIAQQFDDGEWGVAPAPRSKKEYKILSAGSSLAEVGEDGVKIVASVPRESTGGPGGDGTALSREDLQRTVELVQRKGIEKVSDKLLTTELFKYAAETGKPLPSSKIITAVQDIEKGVRMAQAMADRLAKIKGYDDFAAMAEDVRENPEKFEGWGGLVAGSQGMWQELMGKLQMNSDVATIERIKGSMAILLARAFGEVGNLAQAEQARAMLTTPAARMTPSTAVKMMDMLDELIAQGKAAGDEQSTIDPLEWGVKLFIEGDKTPVEDSGEAPTMEGDKTPVEDSGEAPTMDPTIKALADKAAQQVRK